MRGRVDRGVIKVVTNKSRNGEMLAVIKDKSYQKYKRPLAKPWNPSLTF
jgi:hypothetical protein